VGVARGSLRQRAMAEGNLNNRRSLLPFHSKAYNGWHTAYRLIWRQEHCSPTKKHAARHLARMMLDELVAQSPCSPHQSSGGTWAGTFDISWEWRIAHLKWQIPADPSTRRRGRIRHSITTAASRTAERARRSHGLGVPWAIHLERSDFLVFIVETAHRPIATQIP
jgi:hypothetical protein